MYMKKNKIENILNNKGYVSIESLIVAGLVIATGAFLVSKLVWKGKDVANSNNKNITVASKTMDDNSFINDETVSSSLPLDNKVDSECSLENPPDLADYEYAVIDDELIEKQIKDRQNSIDPDGCTDLRGRYNNEPSCGSWKDDFRKRMTSLKGQIVITGYNGNKDNISIPSCINDKKSLP